LAMIFLLEAAYIAEPAVDVERLAARARAR
jgi:hypothetical protein